ncbi:AAA family ATPase [Rhodospirillum sp. A1_3_36]|uniref:AAA family ATPase n=1 Tax=Rhodospirillum sp. A1_3_36 TaxID=3391666 RepID=UPI0039A6DC8D
MTTHSLPRLAEYLEALGQSGGTILVTGHRGPFYAGLRRVPARTLLEAVATGLGEEKYREIIVLSGRGAHLPKDVRVGPNLTVGIQLLSWYLRPPVAIEEKPSATPPVDSEHGRDDDDDDDDDDDFLSFDELSVFTAQRGNRVLQNLEGVDWRSRLHDILKTVEQACGYQWINGSAERMADGPRTGTVIVLDDTLLTPPQFPFAPGTQLEPQSAALLTRRFAVLGKEAKRAGVYLIVLSASEERAQGLRDGTFFRVALHDGQDDFGGREYLKAIDAMPGISLPESRIIPWPTVPADRPFGERVGEANMPLYDALRGHPPREIPDPIARIEKMVGMDQVVQQLRSLQQGLEMEKQRRLNGLTTQPPRLHTILQGPPGTGKTTVARALGEIFADLGILSGGFKAVKRSDLVGSYLGHTEARTRQICQEALGGVLFIDEAHQLASGGETDFGRQAIQELMSWMLDYQDRLAVVIAGYPSEIKTFLDVDPGLPSRFAKTVTLNDYTDDQVIEILRLQAAAMDDVLEEAALPIARTLITNHRSHCEAARQPFSNGRVAENIIREARVARDSRLFGTRPNRDDLTILKAEDFAHVQLDG